jgi:hypothetical protein
MAGSDIFDLLEQDSEAAALFDRAMLERTLLVAKELVRSYDFTGLHRLVDVGGGCGGLLAAILTTYPHASGVLFDRPHAVEGARLHLDQAGLAGRCEFVTGSFFDTVPAGGDTYLLKEVIHDWDDDRSIEILRNCGRAMPRAGRLLLIERIMAERLAADWRGQAIAWMDLAMLIGPGGRERTRDDFRRLLDAAGFTLTREIQTLSDYSIVEAHRS